MASEHHDAPTIQCPSQGSAARRDRDGPVQLEDADGHAFREAMKDAMQHQAARPAKHWSIADLSEAQSCPGQSVVPSASRGEHAPAWHDNVLVDGCHAGGSMRSVDALQYRPLHAALVQSSAAGGASVAPDSSKQARQEVVEKVSMSPEASRAASVARADSSAADGSKVQPVHSCPCEPACTHTDRLLAYWPA